MFSGSRTLCRVQKVPGRRFLCGSLPQWCEGRPPDCVEVQQCYRTLSAMQHQLHTVVSGQHTHTNTDMYTQQANDLRPSISLFSCTVKDERGCPVDTRTGWATLFLFMIRVWMSRICWTLFSLSRLGTTIAAAVGGVVLFFILLGLLFFYLRRQKKLKRKETLRRILQEHEVGVDPFEAADWCLDKP